MRARLPARFFRSAALLGLALCLLPLVGGCPAELPNTKVGAVCTRDNDCSYRYDDSGKVVRLQTCVRGPAPDGYPEDSEPKICTRDCQSRTDCPVGFECLSPGTDLAVKKCLRCRGNFDCPAGTFCEAAATDADGGAPARSCVERKPPAGDFGKDCVEKGDAGCDGAAGFFCHGELPDDPNSYCTKACTADSDCATNMFCGSATEDNVPVGKKRRCLLRTQCSSCRSDAECAFPNSLNTLCVLDDRGRGYCTRTCDESAKMPCTTAAASRGHLECRQATKAGKQGGEVTACVPRFGRCYNQGNVCDPCRAHMPEDCQSCGPGGCTKISGRGCYQTDKGEGVCLQTCRTTDDCGDNAKLESSLRCAAFGSDRICTASSSTVTCWP